MNEKYIYLALYLVTLAIITWLSSRRESVSDFLNSSKKLTAWESLWTTFTSLLTGYNFVIGTTFAYVYGFWYLMAFVGAGIAFFVLYLAYKKRLANLQSDYNLFSIGDYFGIQYGKFTKRLINVIFCTSLFLFLILQIYINTQLFSMLLGTGKTLTLILTTGVVCVYLWFGGFKVSVKTDIFQGVLMLPIILTVISFPSHITISRIALAFDFHQIWFGVGLALLQFLSLLAQPESFQRIFASKDAISLKKGLIAAFCVIILVAGAIAYLGINFKFAGIQGDSSSLFIGNVLPALPVWLSSLLSVSLIAAFMGAIDSSAFALGSLLANASEAPAEKIMKKTRNYISISLILSSIGSVYLFSFLSSVFALISLISIIGTAFLLSLIVNVDRSELNSFLVISSVVYVFGIIFSFITDNPLTSLIPSIVGLIVFVLLRTYKVVIKLKYA